MSLLQNITNDKQQDTQQPTDRWIGEFTHAPAQRAGANQTGIAITYLMIILLIIAMTLCGYVLLPV